MLLEVLDEDLLQDVRTALSEDIGSGDITAALVPGEETVMATVISRETAVLCGMAWFNAVFAELDTGINVNWQARDGETIRPNQVLCTLAGHAAPILTGERTALNFLQTLSGTATLARHYADAVSGLPVRILDTRKTIPPPIAAAGSIAAAVAAARATSPGDPVEVEVENPGQLAAALAAGADSLLLDNFSTAQLSEAARQVAGRITLEASGGVTLDNVRDIAQTGVDIISVGALTKNVHAIDISMLFDNNTGP
jgi:nicotinate-nucleotide pyrophosphorylase (carboxylating)